MTIDRDQMRSDAELGRRLTGTYQADSDPDYYRAMGRIFESVPELLDALDQAEARIHAVREVLDRAEQRHDNAVLFNGANFPAICSAPDIRRALEG